jgi:hypothetical protein
MMAAQCETAVGMTSALLLALAIAGCEREGPAERAGKNVDQAAKQAGDNLEQAGKEIERAAEGKK